LGSFRLRIIAWGRRPTGSPFSRLHRYRHPTEVSSFALFLALSTTLVQVANTPVPGPLGTLFIPGVFAIPHIVSPRAPISSRAKSLQDASFQGERAAGRCTRTVCPSPCAVWCPVPQNAA